MPRLIRKGNRLVLEQEDARAIAERTGRPEPQSPLQAAQMGASMDSAKMIGSGAQKRRAQQEALDPTKQLSTVRRLAGPREEATEEELALTSKAGRLGKLATMAQAAQIEQQEKLFTPQTEAGFQVTEEMVERFGETPDERMAIQGAAQSYIQNPTETTMTALQQSLATTGVTDPTAFLGDIGVTLGQAATGALPTTYSLADLGIEAPEDVAQDLGVTSEELAGYTLEQINDQLETVRQEELSRIDSLKAELTTASPNRKELIYRELEDLGAVGIAAAEAAAEDIQAQVEAAESVEFMGQDYELGDLLDNDIISNAIITAVGDEDALAALAEEHPALATWITENKNQLTELRGAIEQGTKEFKEIQTGFQELVGPASEIATALLGPIDYLTGAQLAEATEQLQASGVWNAALEREDINAALTANPELVEQFETLTQEQITERADIALSLKDPANYASRFMDAPEGAFASEEEINQYRSIESIIEPLGTISGEYKENLEEYIRSGEFDQEASNALAAMEEGDREASVASFLHQMKTQDSYDKNVVYTDDVDANLDNLVNWITDGQSVEDINTSLHSHAQAAKWGDPDAKKLVEKYRYFDSNNDGIVDSSDFKNLKWRVETQMERNMGPNEWLDPGVVFKRIKDPAFVQPYKSNNPLYRSMQDRLDDGQLNLEEIGEFNEEQINMLREDPKFRHQIDSQMQGHANQMIEAFGDHLKNVAFSTDDFDMAAGKFNKTIDPNTRDEGALHNELVSAENLKGALESMRHDMTARNLPSHPTLLQIENDLKRYITEVQGQQNKIASGYFTEPTDQQQEVRKAGEAIREYERSISPEEKEKREREAAEAAAAASNRYSVRGI